MDFSLETKDPGFNLGMYLPILEKEVRSFGLRMEVREKKKAEGSNIRSAFLKGNTREHLLLFYADDRLAGDIADNEAVKIKLEVDVDPPEFATFEHKYRLQPTPYEVNMYDLPSLFAGKIHAVICRAWRNRTKGRDLYDYVFYLSKGAAVNQRHLRARLLSSGFIASDAGCSLDDIKKMLCERFDGIDYAQAKEDVMPFIHDISALDVWNAAFFKQITEGLKVV